MSIRLPHIGWYQNNQTIHFPLSEISQFMIPVNELSQSAQELLHELCLERFDVIGIKTREEDGMPIGLLLNAPFHNHDNILLSHRRDTKLNDILNQMKLGQIGPTIRQGDFRYCIIKPLKN